MKTAVVIGVLVLIVLAICVGASLDTERQRIAAREAARCRQERNADLRALRQERRRLRDERLRLVEERRLQRNDPPDDERTA